MSFYAMQGPPSEWCEHQPLGPFSSIKEADKAIRKDCLDWMNGDEHELGTHDDWCPNYTIIQTIKTYAPSITVSASVKLKKTK